MINYEKIQIDVPGGGFAELFDPNSKVNLVVEFARIRRFIQRAEELCIARPVLELQDVILSHDRDHLSLYDADGGRIDESALSRYNFDGALFYQAAPTLLNPQPELTIDAPVVYSSIFFKHWGHFLIESLARLSVAQADPELARLPSVFSWISPPKLRPQPIAAFFDVIGAPLVETSYPLTVRLRRCFLPPPAFVNSGFATALHLTAPLKVAERLITDTRGAARPAYFSRTRLASNSTGNAKTINETEFEAQLAERGVEIIHMQELPLAEQIRVVNRRRAIIGLWGSALHNILFSLDGHGLSTFVLIRPHQPAFNFLLVDSIVGNRAHYLATLEFESSDAQRIDIEATLAYLADAGVFQ